MSGLSILRRRIEIEILGSVTLLAIMTTSQPSPGISVRIECSDPALEVDERELLIQQLAREIRNSETDLGEVHRPQARVPTGAKSAAAEVLAVLSVLLGVAGLRPLFDYLGVRFSGREFSIEIVVEGRKVCLKARTAEDMRLAYEAATKLIQGGH